jgi:uncharacterized lipoprotein YbaY
MKRTYWTSVVTVLSIVALGGCRDKAAQAAEAEARAGGAPSATRTLESGQQITVAMTENISSRYGKPGDSFDANVLSDVLDDRGRVAIPAGSVVSVTITDVKAAPNPNTSGTLTLAVNSVTVRGKTYPIAATIDSLATERAGRGISDGDAVKVGAGAAAGAIVGQIIGKNTKGTVIGAVVGAAAGAGYAVATKDSDIRLLAGTHVIITLRRRVTFSGS